MSFVLFRRIFKNFLFGGRNRKKQKQNKTKQTCKRKTKNEKRNAKRELKATNEDKKRK
jgi:hypothetical protein